VVARAAEMETKITPESQTGTRTTPESPTGTRTTPESPTGTRTILERHRAIRISLLSWFVTMEDEENRGTLVVEGERENSRNGNSVQLALQCVIMGVASNRVDFVARLE